MGFVNKVGKGFKKMAGGISKAAKDYDSFTKSNQEKHTERKRGELQKLKLETSILQEKDKQKKYKKDTGMWSW